jgi:lipopolysaccharide/colanic/teichoic acid biosynthesis glycosyltransferase
LTLCITLLLLDTDISSVLDFPSIRISFVLAELLEARPHKIEQQAVNFPPISATGLVFESWDAHLSHPRERYFSRKYAIEQVIGWVLLVPFAPLIAVLWLLVKGTSSGPGFYLQTRVGLQGELFSIVKLRTMRCDAEAAGIQWSGKGDPRVTRLGRVLRKLHLDELPQLWNVACGHMCLVGPRPERPEITRTLEKLIPGYQLRHVVKPGVTGLAQVNLEPDSNINLTRKKQVLDLRYVSSASFWLDARLLFATLLRIFGIKGDRAMRMNRLKQEISHRELEVVGYQFDAEESQLWNPNKGAL